MSTRERMIDEYNRLLHLSYRLKSGDIARSEINQEDLRRIDDLEERERRVNNGNI